MEYLELDLDNVMSVLPWQHGESIELANYTHTRNTCTQQPPSPKRTI